MARQRMIKPEFFDSESLGACSIAARLAFIGLWVEADDYGRLKYQPNRLKTRIFGYDRMTPQRVEKLLDELASVGCIEFYEVDGSRYINIPNFGVYQTIQRPSKSAIPGPETSDSLNTHGALNEHSMSTHSKERKKERRRKASNDAFSPKEEVAADGAVTAGAAPPAAPKCPGCGGDLSRAMDRDGADGWRLIWRCSSCGGEVLIDE